MKAFISVVLFCLSALPALAQQDLSIKLIERSNRPLSESEHYYLFEVTNKSSKIFKNAYISIKNIKCDDTNKEESPLDNKSLKRDKISVLNNIDIEPNSVKEFYVKLNRLNNTKLNTWNCSEISISSGDNQNSKDANKNSKKSNSKAELSNSIIIETLIPNPSDFN
jgi:hypothetical protein